jgi:hypothetical protein
MTANDDMATDEEREILLDAALAVFDLDIEPQWRESVLSHLKVAEEQARLVLCFPLEDELVPAPIYLP